MRLRILSRLAGQAGLILILGASAAGGTARANGEPESSESITLPDLGRCLGTWLWLQSDGLVATSTPETSGAMRTLILNPDLTYEYHKRRDTIDSVLCRGRFFYSEQSEIGGDVTDYLDFEGWFEPYEHRMRVDFEGPDTLHLIGDPCETCPEHTFVRGRSALFGGAVKRGEHFRRDLWEGLRLELVPIDYGWKIVVRDTTRSGEDLASLTPPFHFVPNPTDIEGWHFRNKENTGPNRGDVNAPQKIRHFIFSRRVGRSIAKDTAKEITEEDVERVRREGRGVLTIEEANIATAPPGKRAGIESMRFTVAIEEIRNSKGVRP